MNLDGSHEDLHENLLERFETDRIDPGSFSHKHHVLAAYGLLKKYEFLDATTRYVGAIKAIAHRAGAPEKFHVTITLAFLSLIAERMQTRPSADPEEFLAHNPDLLSKRALRHWYTDEHLGSELARKQFVLPRPQTRSQQPAGI